MKRLILIRHAKSDWSNPNGSDHERTLNDRGRRSAQAIGDWLRAHSLIPDQILCSDAARTQETLELLALGDIPTTLTRDLYLAQPGFMARLLKKQTADCVAMVAHNPGSAILADELLKDAPDNSAFDRFPTCATLVIDFEVDTWRDLRMGSGKAAHFVVPRDLID